MSIDVSVIVTAYNIENYIERAIRSALNQQDVRLEVIFVDDCSSDKSFSVASAIDDSRLTCLRLEENGGPSIARNAGIDKAKGEWIAVLDGDDAYAPGRLKNCLQHARTIKADVVIDNLTVRREADGKIFPMFVREKFLRQTTLELAEFIRGNSSFFGSYSLGYLKPIFSNAFLRTHGLKYDPSIHIGEDYFLLAETLASGAICAVAAGAGYLYTARAGSISHRLSPGDLERISACDRAFLSRHVLEGKAAKAQKHRNFAIREAYNFTRLVDCLKRKDVAGALNAFLICPSSIRHLSGAIFVRVKRLNPLKRVQKL